MLKLIYKFIFLILGLFITKNLLDIVILPWYWGNPQVATKMDYLLQQEIQPDTYFIGSSNIFRQIQPNIFDAQTHENTQSFNLGNDGCFTEQNLHILNNLINTSTSKIKYIFLELNGFDDLAPSRYRTTKSKYFTNFSSFWMRYRYIQSSSLSRTRKGVLLKQYIISYYDNFFKIGMLTDIIRYYTGHNYWVMMLGEHKDGYLALPGNQTKSKSVRDYIPKASKTLSHKLNNAYHQKNNKTLNSYHLKLLKTYIEKLKKQQIHLFLLLSPKEFKLETHSELLNLFNQLPAGHRIDLANPLKYPDFFEEKNKWDPGHFNDQGAELFTQELAELFNKKLK